MNLSDGRSPTYFRRVQELTLLEALAPARLLQGVFVDVAVFHNQLEVVFVIHHHFDIVQRGTQSAATGSIFPNPL